MWFVAAPTVNTRKPHQHAAFAGAFGPTAYPEPSAEQRFGVLEFCDLFDHPRQPLRNHALDLPAG